MMCRLSRVVLCASLAAGHLLTGDASPRFADIRKIAAHSHTFEDLPELNAWMRSANLRTINVGNTGNDEHLETIHAIAFDRYRRHPAERLEFGRQLTNQNRPSTPAMILGVATRVWRGRVSKPR
jgi:hypothetical protein